jgi:hypothetical protein
LCLVWLAPSWLIAQDAKVTEVIRRNSQIFSARKV